jgi:hypothetical protein
MVMFSTDMSRCCRVAVCTYGLDTELRSLLAPWVDAVNGVREGEKWGGGKHCVKVYGLKTRGRKKRKMEGE